MLRRAISARQIGAACVVFLCLQTIAAQGQARDLPYIAIDRASGAVLAENRPFDRWYPASLTKLMTLYVTLRAIQAGEIEDGSPVEITQAAARQPPSKMGYVPGTKLRVDTALKILVVKSANDVAVALAQAVAGTTGAFVARMNDEARRIGMLDSHFANPNGLHDTNQFVTARDLALLARRLLVEFPRFAQVFAIPALQSGDTVHYSYNLLLERFPGADGMKTGFVCASGYNMVASATRGGRQVIAVVLGAFSQTERAERAAELLSTAFSRNSGIDVDIARYKPGGSVAPARSQRDMMCSEKARQTRYDPGAGDAVVDSAQLTPRQVTRQPTPIATGGISAPPSEAVQFAQYVPSGSVPIPIPRPDHVRYDIDGIPAAGYAQPAGNIPVPSPRPN